MDEDFKNLHPAIRALKTVCRCNNIKYRTIERVIREGAHTVREVAAKTTATTGHCGGSCTPIVQQMIEEIAGIAPARPPVAKKDEDPDDAWWIRPAAGEKK